MHSDGENGCPRGHFAETIALHEQAEKLDSGLPPLDRELASLYAEAGQMDKAVSRYRSAIEKTPNDAELLNNLAWTLIESKNHTAAETVISQGLSEHPGDERLRSARAYVSYELGKREAALKQFGELYGPAAAHHNVAVLDLQHERINSALVQLTTATEMPGCSEETINLRDTLRTELAAASQCSDPMTR